MKRLNYLFAVALAPMLFTACSDDGTAAEGSTANDEDEDDDDDDATDPTNTTLTTTVGTTTTTTDPTATETTPPETDTTPPETDTTPPETETSPDTDTAASSSSSAGGCTAADECITPADCPNPDSDSCLGCLCIEDPDVVCPGGWGEGTFADCSLDPMVCDANELCVNSGAGTGICTQVDACTDACDCPEPPDGFDAQVSCAPVLADNMDADCFISCENGEACPTGASCFGGLLCIYALEQERFGDCFNAGGVCPETVNSGGPGICLNLPVPTDASGFDGGACSAGPCDDVADCGTPATGTATVTCSDILMADGDECSLDCSNGETCPDGMTCHADIDLCYFEAAVPHYGACIQPGAGTCAGPGGICLSDAGNTLSLCTVNCAVPADCPANTFPGGTAAPVCLDIGVGLTCELGCAAGETCPTGMNCIGDSFCAFPNP